MLGSARPFRPDYWRAKGAGVKAPGLLPSSIATGRCRVIGAGVRIEKSVRHAPRGQRAQREIALLASLAKIGIRRLVSGTSFREYIQKPKGGAIS